MGAVISEDGVDLVRNNLDQLFQEISGCFSGGLINQLCEGEFGSAVHSDKKVELSLLRADLGQIDMKVADRIGLELLAGGARSIEMRQATDSMTLKAAMERGSGKLGDGGLQCVETIIEWQQGMFTKGNSDGLLVGSQRCRARFLRSHRRIFHEGALAPLLNGLGVDAIPLGKLQEALLTMLDRATHRRRRAGAAM